MARKARRQARFFFGGEAIFLKARSAPFSVSSASAFFAASRKRLCCAGSLGFGEAFSRVVEVPSFVSEGGQSERAGRCFVVQRKDHSLVFSPLEVEIGTISIRIQDDARIGLSDH